MQERSRIDVFAQRQVNALTGELESYELLSRFINARGDTVENIRRLAELNQLIDFDRYMAGQIIKNAPGMLPRDAKIAFNLSAHTLSDMTASSDIAQMLCNSGKASRFNIEVTETEKPKSIALIRRSLSMIQESGAGISLDDFGEGYNSFAAVEYCNPVQIKLSSRVIQLGPKILESVRQLVCCHTDNLVIEGVESRLLVEKAQDIFGGGGVWLQGFAIHRPEYLFTALGSRPDYESGCVDYDDLSVMGVAC